MTSCIFDSARAWTSAWHATTHVADMGFSPTVAAKLLEGVDMKTQSFKDESEDGFKKGEERPNPLADFTPHKLDQIVEEEEEDEDEEDENGVKKDPVKKIQ
eukprot:2459286-Rhodomonas_salina.1